MRYDVVTIITSSRGIAPLRQLLGLLPSTFPRPVVCLVPATARLLDELQPHATLRLRWAEPGVPLEPGNVYFNRPQSGLVWRPDGILASTPVSIDAESLRPVDAFLSSGARSHGRGMLTLVLGGFDLDGVAGARAAREAGGGVLVLDRATARYWGLAEPIVRANAFDGVLGLAEIADTLRASFGCEDLLACARVALELRDVLEEALDVVEAPMGLITRRQAAGPLGHHVMVEHGLGTRFLEHFDVVQPGRDPACDRALNRGRIIIPDLMESPAHAAYHNTAFSFGFRGVHLAPIAPDTRQPPRGALATLFADPCELGAEMASRLDTLATRAAALLGHLDA